MLAVSGLARSTLGSYIDKTNVRLPENAKLYIGLHTGARNAVVVGPARSLYGLVTALQKIRAPAGVDQSKIPYTQRKTMFSMCFLVTVMYVVVFDSLFILHFHGLCFSSRLRFAQGYYFAHAPALRPDVHTPPTLA